MKLKEFELGKYEQRTIPSPGLCIYCRKPFPPDELTNEHVIPFALGHNTLIYKKSSCRPCAETIQPYEQAVLREQLGTFRLQVDAPSRTNRKDRSKSVDLPFIEVDATGKVIRNLGTRTFMLGDAPLALNLWQLSEPRIMRTDAIDGDDVGEPWSYTDTHVAIRISEEVRQDTGAVHVAMKVGEVNRNHFLRFLAKAAHAYTTAELGIDGFEPFLNDIILNRDNDLSKYVGGTLPDAPHKVDPAYTTLIALGSANGLLAVRLQFYPILGSPAYAVVVGEPNENTEGRINEMIARYS
ncbi:MAG: HNH endonuclease [Parasphingopyxis sp.]